MSQHIENDYSLLRDFDLEAAKQGDLLLTRDRVGAAMKYVAGPDFYGYVVTANSDGAYTPMFTTNELKMAPIFWLEGKPVYKGDTLYWHKKHGKRYSFKPLNVSQTNNEVIIGNSYAEDGTLRYDGENEGTGCQPCDLQWEKHKTKKEGWVNIYPSDREMGCVIVGSYPTEDKAKEFACTDAITTVKIEWEE